MLVNCFLSMLSRRHNILQLYSSYSKYNVVRKKIVFCCKEGFSCNNNNSSSRFFSTTWPNYVKKRAKQDEINAENPPVEVKSVLKEITKDFEESVDEKTQNESEESDDENPDSLSMNEKIELIQQNLNLSLRDRFQIFEDKDSPVILDSQELATLEKFETVDEIFSVYPEEAEDEFAGISLRRGVKGVFDVEELVEILRMEKARDICVISIPPEKRYADYLVIVSAVSVRHLKAMSEFFRKLYKRKKGKNDAMVIVEGKTCSDWKVFDFGNIVLHLFMEETRALYDLETLWAVGSQFDDLIKRAPEDEILTLLEPHIRYLDDLEPLATPPTNQMTRSK